MGNNQSYVERREEQQDNDPFGNPFSQGMPNPAKPMLEISCTNRILVSDRQAVLLNLVSLHHYVLQAKCRTKEGKELFEKIGKESQSDVQCAQLTRDSMSREDYIRIAAAASKSKKLSLNPFSPKKSSTDNIAESED